MSNQIDQFLGTTQIYDLGKDNKFSQDFTSRLRNNLNDIILTLNSKQSGLFSQSEILNGQLFYPDYTLVNSATTGPPQGRQVYHKSIPTGTLPNIGTSTTAHGITFLPTVGNTTFRATRVYGAATDPAGKVMLPLPYSSPTLNQNISVYADATNVYITTGINRTAFTESQIIIEFIKDN